MLQIEEKSCPVCDEQNFRTVPDKHYRGEFYNNYCEFIVHTWDVTGLVRYVRGYSVHIEACLV